LFGALLCVLVLSPRAVRLMRVVGTVVGSAYGIAKAGIGISSVGVMKPDFVIKALVPVIFAAAIGIYGLIIAVLISDNGARVGACLGRA
jgi:V-type H+-transporting ATPase proteolipid subunit